MSFLAPFALIGLALAMPILLLYMLRLRRREVVISSTYLWQQVLQDTEANTPWQKLRRNLLLILQLLILLLMVLALARPFIIVPAVSAGRIAVMLDASVSMNSTDSADGTRFDEAKHRAIELVDTMSLGDTMTVIRVAGAPEILIPYTADRAALRAAIEAAQPSYAPADWNAALTLAAAGAAGSEDYAAVIISDGCVNDATRLPPIPGDLEYIPVGSSAENVAITALAARALPGEPPQLFAQVTNFGLTDAEIIFSLRTDGTLFSADRYTIPAGTRLAITDFPPLQDYTVLEAAITYPVDGTFTDYLESDNTAWTVGGTSGARRVLLMSEGNLFLEQVLRILPNVQTFRGTLEQGLPSGEFDVSIFDRYLPPVLPNGDLLLIDPPSSTVLFTVGEETTETGNIRVSDDPLMALIDFSTVNVRAFNQVSASWAAPLITADGGALLLAGETSDRQIAILTFNLADSDLPLQIPFVALMSTLLDWFQPANTIIEQTAARVGAPVTVRLIGDADDARVTLPDGSTRSLGGEGAARFFSETDLPGVYTVELFAGGQVIATAPFVVNSTDSRESDITPRPTLTIGGAEISIEEEEDVGQQEFWSWLALAALIVLMIEWYAYHQRMNAPTLFKPLVRRRA